MTKKRIFGFIVLVLTICLTCCLLFACNDNTPDKPDNPNTPDTPDTPDVPDDSDDTDDTDKPQAKFYEQKEGYTYGEDVEITYHSNVTDTDRKALVTLPANYDSSKKYPVLYLLHGMSCDYKYWNDSCSAKYVVQNLHVDKGVREMIIVAVDSNITNGKVPSWTSTEYFEMFDKTGEELVNSLMPYINANYSTLTGRGNTAIAGFSMGGRETLLTAFAYQDYFNYVGAFSPSGFGDKAISTDTTVPDFKYEKGKNFSVLMLAIGNMDTMTGLFYPHIDSKLSENNIKHFSKIYMGGHAPSVWRNALYDFVQLIFKK